jgi:hypothetical protein
MIRKGEYDLVNICLIGYDPVTGKNFEDCHREWTEYFEETKTMRATTPWWNIKRHIQIKWRLAKLTAKQGMGA